MFNLTSVLTKHYIKMSHVKLEVGIQYISRLLLTISSSCREPHKDKILRSRCTAKLVIYRQLHTFSDVLG